MLVLLVSDDGVVVDDARPAPDGAPLSHLLFDGPLVEGEGGRMLPGPDLVYRLVGRADLLTAYGDPSAALVGAQLGEMLRALPVYLQLDPQAARAWREASVTGHPVASVPTPRPHLRLAPPVELVRGPDGALERVPSVPAPVLEVGAHVAPADDGDPFCLFCSRVGLPTPHAHESDDHPAPASLPGQLVPASILELGELPTFTMDGVVAALGVGGLVPGMVIRIAGMTQPALDGPYVVGVVRPSPDGVDCDMLPLADRPGVDAVEHLRREAVRAREAAEELRSTNPEGALALVEAAAGYERHAARLASTRSGL